jgi:two-component system phosphate regulon sensor histidine kinase PhoR
MLISFQGIIPLNFAQGLSLFSMKYELQKYSELKAVFSSMVEAVIVVDEKGNITNLNHAAARLLNVEANKLIGGHYINVIRNPDMHRFFKEILNSQGPVEREIAFLSSDNEQLYLQIHGVLIRDKNLKKARALAVFNDVTKLRRLESIRSDFVANVSHELKTPITTIKGFVETLSEGAVDDPIERKHFLDIILKNADRLHSIVEDLLTLSRVEEEDRKAQIILQSESIAKPIVAAIEACSLKAFEKGIRIVFDCPEEIKAKINSPLLEQAVANLIVNSIKYSEENTTVILKGRADDDAVTITVKDHGSGIAEEHLPRLFERFYRSDKARSRKLGGTGLGLAIVKHIVSAHNGKVKVKSRVGEGSTFTIKLPSDAAKVPA